MGIQIHRMFLRLDGFFVFFFKHKVILVNLVTLLMDLSKYCFSIRMMDWHGDVARGNTTITKQFVEADDG